MGSKENIFPVSVCMRFKIRIHSSETKCKAYDNDDSIILGNKLKNFTFKSAVSNFTKQSPNENTFGRTVCCKRHREFKKPSFMLKSVIKQRTVDYYIEKRP